MADGLILVTEGMRRLLDLHTAAIDGQRWMGLMRGTTAPTKSWTILNVQPANFSGYGGTQRIVNWKPATLDGELAVAKAQLLVWQHDGGVGSHAVTGYYVIDSNGKLHWAELFPEPWQVMAQDGDRFAVTPTFAQGSRYPREG